MNYIPIRARRYIGRRWRKVRHRPDSGRMRPPAEKSLTRAFRRMRHFWRERWPMYVTRAPLRFRLCNVSARRRKPKP
jgi:hypothetical protein